MSTLTVGQVEQEIDKALQTGNMDRAMSLIMVLTQARALQERRAKELRKQRVR